MRLEPRHAKVAFALFMATSMSMVMSLVITLFNLRSHWDVQHWLHAWLLAFGVAFPLILILAPLGQKLVARLTHART